MVYVGGGAVGQDAVVASFQVTFKLKNQFQKPTVFLWFSRLPFVEFCISVVHWFFSFFKIWRTLEELYSGDLHSL